MASCAVVLTLTLETFNVKIFILETYRLSLAVLVTHFAGNFTCKKIQICFACNQYGLPVVIIQLLVNSQEHNQQNRQIIFKSAVLRLTAYESHDV